MSGRERPTAMPLTPMQRERAEAPLEGEFVDRMGVISWAAVFILGALAWTAFFAWVLS